MSTARPELLALLDAVKDHPDDDTPRLVLADWLDEQENSLDAARANFIRRDIGRAPELLVRSRTLTEAEEAERLFPLWLGPVAALGSGRFERGLPVLSISGPRLLKPDVPALLASEEFAFVQCLHLVEAGGARMPAMTAVPEFQHVPALSAHPFTPLGTHSAAKFFGSPNLGGMRQIALRGVYPGAVGMQALAANPALARLRKLALAHNKLVDKSVTALAVGKHLARLEVLDLSDNNIGDAGARALVESQTLANLRELNLQENSRLTDGGKAALRERFGHRVNLTSQLFS
ncbi:TIGR02996 domain-containing protein [Gemmata sp. G18]|uniref:TIGR02996 domain-containing protein n=1 Tax=Gemmata palustris TaxID=2822762 RepID=A0ABS5C0U4_9BACT|nr:TIGR02996 domain-containing protein [Gemmata palustris]MBP3959605.1 TIGR02996 domain-containing protein [Gemmata palustris]